MNSHDRRKLKRLHPYTVKLKNINWRKFNDIDIWRKQGIEGSSCKIDDVLRFQNESDALIFGIKFLVQ